MTPPTASSAGVIAEGYPSGILVDYGSQQRACGTIPPLFVDGFNRGTTGAWSATNP